MKHSRFSRFATTSLAAICLVVSVSFTPQAQAASGTWLNTGATNANWTQTTNWSAVPGSTATITGINANADTATFNTSVGSYGTTGTPILIDSSSENLKSITFDTSAGNYFIGTTGGNALYLSSGGTIQIASTATTTAVETINAPLVIEGANGTYTFANNRAVAGASLVLGGTIRGGYAGNTVITFGGHSTPTMNYVNGIISDGSATTLGITQLSANNNPNWTYAGNNTYTGPTKVSNGTAIFTGTNSGTGAITVSGGTMKVTGAAGAFSATSSITLGATLTVGDATAGNGLANRLNTAATLTIGGGNTGDKGTFTMVNGSTTPNDQTLASLTVNTGYTTNGGNNVINGSGTTNKAALTFGGAAASVYSRTLGGFVNLDPTNLAAINFTNAPTGTSVASGVLIGALKAGNDFILAQAGAITAPTYVNDAWSGGHTTVTASSAPSSGSTTNSLRFGAGAFTVTLAGTNTLTSGGIVVGSTATSGAISGGSMQVGAAAGDIWIYLNGKPLTISSNILDNGGSTLSVGSNGGGSLTLSGTNTYTGGTKYAGSLTVGSAGALGTGALTTTGYTTLQFNTAGDATIPNNIATYSANGTPLFTNASATATVTLSGNNTFNTTNTWAIISGQGVSAGGVVLTGNNSFQSRALELKNVSLTVGSAAALGSSGLIKFADDSGVAAALYLRNGVTLANAIQDTQYATYTNTRSMTLGVTAGNATLSGEVDLHKGASAGTANWNFDAASGATLTFSNVIKMTNTSVGTVTVTKTGAGTVVFSGTNTYTGSTAVSNGTLLTTKAAALPGYNAAGKLSVANAATLAVRAGGVGEWTSAQIDSVLGATTAAFASGSNLGIDVTTGNAFAYANDLGTTRAAKGLVKSSAGTLTLTGTNTYTGATAVNGGMLRIDSSGTINTSSGVAVAAGAKFVYNSSTALTVATTLSGNTITNRAVLGGSGTVGTSLTLDNVGDTLAPGNSPGILAFTPAQTWSSFSYDWEVKNFTGTAAGTYFDQVAIANTLNLTGSSGNYILNVLGLTAGDVSGAVPNFSEISRSWTILTSTGGITGFNAAHWTINTTGFTDPNTGTWSLAQSSNNIVLSYTAVPEPNIAALLGGLGSLALLRRRR